MHPRILACTPEFWRIRLQELQHGVAIKGREAADVSATATAHALGDVLSALQDCRKEQLLRAEAVSAILTGRMPSGRGRDSRSTVVLIT